MARAMKVCSCLRCEAHPGSCPQITDGRHCAPCARAHDKTRGRRQQRGYDRDHDAIRARLLRDLVPGTPCDVCGKPMRPTDKLDAAHGVDLRVNPNANADRLQHATCNRGWRKGMKGSAR